MFSHQEECFCAFCKSPKRIYKARSLKLHHFVLSALAAVTLIYLVKQEIHPSAVIVFISLLLICELFLRIRWRMALVCRQCGFDPVLYRKNIGQTVEKVKLHMERRKADPNYLLAKPLKLPTITPEKAQAIAELQAQLNHMAKSEKRASQDTVTALPKREGAIINRQI